MRITLLFILLSLTLYSCNQEKIKPGTEQNIPGIVKFSFEQDYSYPGTPDFIFEKITGDISPWWDHSFSDNPDSLFIQAWPGGGFYEYFDGPENGALHARVIYSDKGKILRMNGPFGLSGYALDMTVTYNFSKLGKDSAKLSLLVNGIGNIPTGIDTIIAKVWDHFLGKRFSEYIGGLSRFETTQ